jgi:hypothetical protein
MYESVLIEDRVAQLIEFHTPAVRRPERATSATSSVESDLDDLDPATTDQTSSPRFLLR